VFPPNPSAGARLGNNFRARASNGYVWVEDLANTLGAKLIDYSVGGAVVDLAGSSSQAFVSFGVSRVSRGLQHGTAQTKEWWESTCLSCFVQTLILETDFHLG
jgi:hypothetical protein